MIVRRGEVWLVDFDPTEGHEQAGKRPALVLSEDAFHATEMATVLPITSKFRQVRSRIEVRPPTGGLTMTSWVICEQVRSVSTKRLIRRLGMVGPDTLALVGDCVRTILGL